ncbi:hypothetical protein CY34DRAFT_806542 [Suillus luteus UH-Slu-Lm8-n1]|uniref:Uncharacterized protein n=1 Tax=Suillus luteus UH-Slu-Lm8-n1 TaxID=930992 RepID=A0A0D0AGY6_9AGAM|nr:hypothetical protein CY34DRAFT_806542 [Suillus luteus UH-Slu-Lm8-n1]
MKLVHTLTRSSGISAQHCLQKSHFTSEWCSAGADTAQTAVDKPSNGTAMPQSESRGLRKSSKT